MKKAVIILLAALCAAVLFGRGRGDRSQSETPGAWTSIGPFGGDIVALARNPKSPAELYAVSQSWPSQVWRSTNGGGGWTRQSAVLDRVYDLAADPKTPGKIYLLGYNTLQVSTDRGKTFVSFRLPSGFGGTYGRIAVHPSNPKIIIVSGWFYWDATNYKSVIAVIKTANGGTSWTVQRLTSGSDYGYGRDVAFAKGNPNYVYLCGDEQKNNTSFPRAFVSKNGGGSWKSVGSPAVFGGDSSSCYALHVDARDPKKAWVAHFNGIARTSNAGGSWKAQQTPLISYVTAIAADASNPKVLYAGGQMNYVRGALKSTDGGVTWSLNSKGVYGDSRRILASGPKVYWAGTVGLFLSKDSGATWNASHNGIRAANIDVFAVASSSPNTILVGIYRYTYVRTANGGALWTPCGAFYGSEFAGSVAVNPANPNMIYIKPSG